MVRSRLAVTLCGILLGSPAIAQEEGTVPGAIPDPSTYQGSMVLQQQSDALGSGASTVTGVAGRLDSALSSLADYLARTDGPSLDPAYLKAQLAYLKPAVAEVRSGAGSLGQQAQDYLAAVQAFGARVSAYAAELHRLQQPTG